MSYCFVCHGLLWYVKNECRFFHVVIYVGVCLLYLRMAVYDVFEECKHAIHPPALHGFYRIRHVAYAENLFVQVILLYVSYDPVFRNYALLQYYVIVKYRFYVTDDVCFGFSCRRYHD
mgnify:CR=1 FL=1